MITRFTWFTSVFIACVLPCFLPSAALAAESTTSATTPYCGLYAVYGAAKYLGNDHTSFQSLLRPEFIGSSREGSSLAELSAAARYMNLTCSTLEDLSPRDLALLPAPLILHVKADRGTPSYNHFILCLSANSSTARILNPPGAVQSVDLGTLASSWDGTALLLAPADARPPSTRLPLFRRTFYILLTLATGFALLRFGAAVASHARHAFTTSVAGVLSILVVAAGLAIFYHLQPGGFLHATSGVLDLESQNADLFMPRVSLSQLRHALQSDLLIVDARVPIDFSRGHIPNAINLDTDLSQAAIESRLELIPKNRPVVVYCQNSGCRYSNVVAKKIAASGFHDVRIFPGGWEEWLAPSNPSSEASQ